jgi:hypothetical protein
LKSVSAIRIIRKSTSDVTRSQRSLVCVTMRKLKSYDAGQLQLVGQLAYTVCAGSLPAHAPAHTMRKQMQKPAV